MEYGGIWRRKYDYWYFGDVLCLAERKESKPDLVVLDVNLCDLLLWAKFVSTSTRHDGANYASASGVCANNVCRDGVSGDSNANAGTEAIETIGLHGVHCVGHFCNRRIRHAVASSNERDSYF